MPFPSVSPKGDAMAIERVCHLPPDRFVHDYVRVRRPVVVVDALSPWFVPACWGPAWLRRELGPQLVQVYDGGFGLLDVMPLHAYLDRYFDSVHPSSPTPYVRWYTQLRDVDFVWADEAFATLRHRWKAPTFWPDTDYVLPRAAAPQRLDPVLDRFPAKGLFVSGRGARTDLHVDPWGSDAVLCQLYGTKTWRLYRPERDAGQHRAQGQTPVAAPPRDPGALPEQADYTFQLRPGETVYVPRGWRHEVTSDTDCISWTWNFVHAQGAEELAKLMQGELSSLDESVLSFFLGPHFRQRHAR
jgi:hypothetical protein